MWEWLLVVYVDILASMIRQVVLSREWQVHLVIVFLSIEPCNLLPTILLIIHSYQRTFSFANQVILQVTVLNSRALLFYNMTTLSMWRILWEFHRTYSLIILIIRLFPIHSQREFSKIIFIILRQETTPKPLLAKVILIFLFLLVHPPKILSSSKLLLFRYHIVHILTLQLH